MTTKEIHTEREVYIMGKKLQKSLLKNEKYLVALASLLTALGFFLKTLTECAILIFNTFFK